jgi:hypothetical protein
MRKIRLDPDRLAVQSFSTADESRSIEGTVRAQGATVGCQTYRHEGCGPTQFQTCAWTVAGAPCFC